MYSPKTFDLRKEELRSTYYQKDILYKGDGKYKSPKKLYMKSGSKYDNHEREFLEEDMHITNIISDHCIETID